MPENIKDVVADVAADLRELDEATQDPQAAVRCRAAETLALVESLLVNLDGFADKRVKPYQVCRAAASNLLWIACLLKSKEA